MIEIYKGIFNIKFNINYINNNNNILIIIIINNNLILIINFLNKII